MRDLQFGLSGPPSPYVDLGSTDDGRAEPGPAGRAAQARDGHVCQFCGFHSLRHQRCVGTGAERADDLVTACTFCEQVLRVDLAVAQRSGVLIWLPEMSQATLNRAMPELYVRRLKGGQTSAGVREILDRMIARRDLAKSEFGSDDPQKLAEHLRAASPDAARALMADGLRLLPLDRLIVRKGGLEFNLFPMVLAYWRSDAGPLAPARSVSFTDFELGLVAV